MKKIIIIFVNIFAFIISVFLIDLYAFKKDLNYFYGKENRNFIKSYCEYYKKAYEPVDLHKRYIWGETKTGENFYRKVLNENSNLRPILLFGCSYIYGYKIPENNFFSYLLAKYTKRPVYNRAKDAVGTAVMLYQLQNEDFYKLFPKPPKYVIYTFLNDHIRRMYIPCSPLDYGKEYQTDIFYKLKNKKLKLKKKYFPLYFIESLKYHTYSSFQKIYELNAVDLLRAQILESEKLIHEHWKDTKFIIFVYSNEMAQFGRLKDEFEAHNIKVIHRKDITPFDDYDMKYCLAKYDSHPNSRAWKYVTPKFAEALEKF